MNTSEHLMNAVSAQGSGAVTRQRDSQSAKGSMNSVLIVDDEAGIRSFLQKGLASRFGLIEVAGDRQ